MSTVNVSVRELRLVVGRLLYVADLPKGCVYPVRDALVDAQSLGLDALGALERTFASLPGRLGAANVEHTDGRTVIDGGAQPSYLVSPAVLDVMVAAARSGAVAVEVTNVLEPNLLTGVAVAAYQHQLEVTVVTGVSTVASTVGRPYGAPSLDAAAPDRTLLIATPSNRAPTGPVASPHALGGCARDALSAGFDLDADLWWRMFELSNDALTPDSERSRHHAGASLLDHGGKIIGEIGEDDDYKQVAGIPTHLAI